MNILRTSKLLKCYKLPATYLHNQQLSISLSLLSNHSFFQTVIVRHASWQPLYTSISLSTPVLTVQNFLIDFHNFSELPWWFVIMLTTIGIRTFIIFPIAWHQNQVIARYTNVNFELGSLIPELNKEVNIAARLYKWDEKTAKRVFKHNVRRYYQKFIIRDNCHPFKTVVLALFQIPIWFCFSVSLRNLTLFVEALPQGAEVLFNELKSEGTLWFSDLTIPDPIFIPVLLATVNLVLIEMSSFRNLGKTSKYQKILLYFMRAVIILIAAIATITPASVSFYWLCSSTFGLMQNSLLMIPRIRRILKIPKTANESSTPFKDIALNFRKRFLS